MWNKVHANDIILICDVAVAKRSFKKEFLVLHKRQCFLFQMLYKYGICRWFLREKTKVLCCIFTFWMIEFKLGNVFKDKIRGMENSSRVSELRKKWDRKLCMLLILFFHDYFTVDRIDNGTSQHVSFELQLIFRLIWNRRHLMNQLCQGQTKLFNQLNLYLRHP